MFKAAFEQQVEYFAEIVATASNVVIPVRAELNPTPFLSVFIDHRMEVCRENGDEAYPLDMAELKASFVPVTTTVVVCLGVDNTFAPA